MLLSLKQRYVVDVLDKLGCIRRDQLYILTRDAFKTEEYTLTENQMEAVIKNLPHMVNNIRLENGCVRYDTAKPDPLHLEAIDVMLELSNGYPIKFRALRDTTVLLRFALGCDPPRQYSIAAYSDAAAAMNQDRNIVWISEQSLPRRLLWKEISSMRSACRTALTASTAPANLEKEDLMPRKKAVPEEEQSIVQETVTAAPKNVEQTEVHEESPLRQFFSLNFNELDRDLKEDERAEWNAIYASFRSKSALSGKIIGVDRFTNDMGNGNIQDVYCAIVIPYRVRIVIPAGEMWMDNAPPDFVFRGMVGAKIEFVITRVEREAGFAMASRREAMRNRRYYFSHRSELSKEGATVKCQVLSVGPRRCTVECNGYDLNVTQRDLSYTAIADLRTPSDTPCSVSQCTV